METGTPQDMFDALCEPFSTDEIEWRVGPTNKSRNGGDAATKGVALAYIDARTVMDRLDSVCGMDGWQCNYTAGVNGSIVCNIGVRTAGNWVWKADGAGATDMEAEKGALSDAFKRAAVRFGIGRYLYELDSPWVELEGGKFIKKTEIGKLNELHDKAASRFKWGTRSGIYAYRVLVQTIKRFVTQPADAVDFEKDNAGVISQLPVAMREHLKQELARIGATQKEVAQ